MYKGKKKLIETLIFEQNIERKLKKKLTEKRRKLKGEGREIERTTE